jgi:hypothetical protein
MVMTSKRFLDALHGVRALISDYPINQGDTGAMA